ncbi:tRNA lysidine(34) synthetase TilS [Paenibacillaceae bacterium T2]|uniref:tRNA(Ile)-lysidine synthase n=2 Tax=Ferviditalea candida TaxID=3108399 RepID=A0ABU5ZLD8_9BACL|nr:tRNA lysidine(34) synthetase TilS [Paenibacillaceae bacterium T2]
MDLPRKVEKIIGEERLLSPGDTVVVAVSGGPDSVALLHVLYRLSPSWRWRLVVAHVNHQFRIEESAKEAWLVERLAAEWGLSFELSVIDVPKYREESGMNAQAAAREKRYAFLSETAEKYDAGKIALGHHADDQAETVMMRILRGTGPSGLAGIPLRRNEKNTELVRPLLRIYKSELLEYCAQEGLPTVTDSSNELRKYFRNRIRLDVLPFLAKYNEQLPQSLNRLAEQMRAEDDFMEQETHRLAETLLERERGELRFSRKSLQGVPLALQRRLIKLILSYLASHLEYVDFVMIESIRTAVLREGASTFTLDLGREVRLIREYDRIRLLNADPHSHATGSFHYPLQELPVSLEIPEAGMRIRCEVFDLRTEQLPSDYPGDGKLAAFFDLGKLDLPLAFRNRLPGDRFRPMGVDGSKKVKDLFIDHKISYYVRDRIPLLVDGQQRILWIPGLRRSALAPIDASTSHVLQIRIIKGNLLPFE